MTSKIPVFSFEGTHLDIGYQHGLGCRSRIEKSISFYDSLFKLETTKLKTLANHFKEQIMTFNPKFATEIEAIAEGADVEPYWI